MPFAANSIWVNVSTSGLADFTMTTALASYQNFVDAGVPNGATVHYTARTATEFENGEGVYNSGTGVVTRVTIFDSSNAGGKVNFGSSPTLAISPLAEDAIFPPASSTADAIVLWNGTGGDEVKDSGVLISGLATSARQIISGGGLTGGGNLTADRTLAVGAGTGITVNADDVALDTGSTLNTDHAGVTLTAGAGLTGGGDISASRSFAVGAGTGITVNADDVALTNMAQSTVKGRAAGAGTGAPTDLSAAQVQAIISPLPVANGGTGQTTEAEALGEMIQALTADTAPDALADYIATYDASADTGKKVLLSTATREILTANRTYYVRTDGSDSNTGLVDNSGGAFLTLQRAITAAQSLDIRTFNVTIQVRSGTYTSGIYIHGPWVGSGDVYITGDTTTPSNVVISTAGICVQVVTTARCHIGGFKLVSSGSYGLYVSLNSTVVLEGKMDFGACAFAQIGVSDHSTVRSVSVNHNITAGGGWWFGVAERGSTLHFASCTVTLSGTPSYAVNFVACYLPGSSIDFDGVTFAGTGATGSRYDVQAGGCINTHGGGTSFFPGSVAGSGTNYTVAPWGLYLA